MATPWTGSRRLAFILADVVGGDPRIPPAPPNWAQSMVPRIQALDIYIRAVSFNRASVDARVFGPYTVQWGQNGCQDTAINAIRAARGPLDGFPYACVVFSGGPCDGWAFYGPFGRDCFYPASTVGGYCYVDMEASLGTWAMENIHIVTFFHDLYGIPGSPGDFDEMACSCGTHPSFFTKSKLGWVSNPTAFGLGAHDATILSWP